MTLVVGSLKEGHLYDEAIKYKSKYYMPNIHNLAKIDKHSCLKASSDFTFPTSYSDRYKNAVSLIEVIVGIVDEVKLIGCW